MLKIMCSQRRSIIKLPHHEKQEICLNRPPYRQGRKFTAIKVYTVNDESQHLIVFGVPQIKLKDELYRLASKYGIIKSLSLIENYEHVDNDESKFTDTYHLHYRRIQAARFAKRQLDEKCFFGGVLHVCYAPELETVAETRIKLVQRRREVSKRIEVNSKDAANSTSITKSRILQRSKKHPALPLTEERFKQFHGNQLDNSQITGSVSHYGNSSTVIEPSAILLQTSNSVYGPMFQPCQSDTAAEGGVREQYIVKNRQQSSDMNQINTFSSTPYLPSKNNASTSSQLSGEQMKTLCFVPTQISNPNVLKTKILNNKKRIVFHNKK